MTRDIVAEEPAAAAAPKLFSPKAVLFDLDGTLVDSVPDLHAALNETLASYGEPPFTIEAVTEMVGAGVPTLIERAYARLGKDIDPASRDKAVERFGAIYEPRATELTTLMPGATGAINALAAKGFTLGVVTNKYAVATKTVLSHFGLLDHMSIVIGGDAGPSRKPAPDLILLACTELGIAPGEALFVGDSENDVRAAKAAGMPVAVLEGGYTTIPASELGADFVVARLDALLDHLSRAP